ncbi:3-methyladenine DNA glycosylase [compost metagenome]
MSLRRGKSGRDISNGPAKLCQALGIDKVLNGHNLDVPPLLLIMRPPLPSNQIVQTTRIGIRQAQDVPWRFYIKDNPYVSK